MQLLPRLTTAEARALATQYRDSDTAPPYRAWCSEDVLTLYRRTCLAHHQTWLGVWVWPDGMATMVPVPREGQTLQDTLAEMYESIRGEVERQVLIQSPPAGEA